MKKNYLIPTVKCLKAILEHGLLADTDPTKGGPSANFQNNPGMESATNEGEFDEGETDLLPSTRNLW